MIGSFSDLSITINNIIHRTVPDFIMTEDVGHIIYTWKHKLHGKKKGAPSLTLQAHTEGKGSTSKESVFELIDGDNLVTGIFGVTANDNPSMHLKTEKSPGAGIGYYLPLVRHHPLLVSGPVKILITNVFVYFYIVVCTLFDECGGWDHTITKTANQWPDIFKLTVKSTRTLLFKKYERDIIITAQDTPKFSILIFDVIQNRKTSVELEGWNAFFKALFSLKSTPYNARYESENRRLDILIDSMRNG